MRFSTGIKDKWITILNRKEAKTSAFGLDGEGVEWEEVESVWANITWAKGPHALNAGAIDVYLMKLVRMDYTPNVTDRSRIKYDGKIYQVLPGSLNGDAQADTIQLTMQLIIND